MVKDKMTYGHARHATWGLCLFLFLGQIWLNQRLISEGTAWVEPPAVMGKWDPRIFRLMSVGNLPAALDWIFIKCLTDPTTNQTPPGTHSAFYYNLELIADLDPPNFDIYQVGGNLLNVLHRDGPGARDLLIKGNTFLKEELPYYPQKFKEKIWQTPWVIPVLMAYTYLFQLDDMPHASEGFQEAAGFPAAPSYLRKLEQRLKRPGGEYEVGLKLIGFMIEGAKDDRVRERLEKKKQDLFVAQYIDELNRSFLGFLKLQTQYNLSGSLSQKQMDVYLKNFLKRNQIPQLDPWGGSIQVDSHGRIVSTTPYEPVFGLK